MAEHFIVGAALGRQTIKAEVRSDTVDEMVADWGKHLKADDPEKRRSDTSAVVVISLSKGTHHTIPEETRAIASALVWLAATGPMGEQLLELMRGGDVTISYEIMRLREDAYDFRLSVDDKSLAALESRHVNDSKSKD
jgi:hypothetical protein